MGGAAPFEVTPLDATCGAVVTGLKLTELDDGGVAALYQAWLDHALLIFPGQHLDDARQIAFAGKLGALEILLTRLGNVDEEGRVRPPDHDIIRTLDGNRFWHCDSTFKPVQAKGAVFTARVVPDEGGETEWADMRAAYDALDEAMRARVETLSAHHSLKYSQARNGFEPEAANTFGGAYAMTIKDPPLRPLVKIHPETGRKSLNIGRHACWIPGMTEDESERFLDELIAFACQPPRIARHRWTAGDCVLWDNRCLVHRVLPWDIAKPRDMRHTRLAGHPIAEFAAAALS